MERRRFMSMLAATATATTLAPRSALWAQSSGPAPDLMALLARLPESFLNRNRDYPAASVGFVDMEAARQVASDPMALMQRLVVRFDDGRRTEEGWPQTVGFGMPDLRGYVVADRTPLHLNILDLAPGVAASAAAVLQANGYTETDVSGTPLLVRGEDDMAVDLAAVNRDDPFGRGMGLASRIGITGDVMVQGNTLAEVAAVTAAVDPPWPLLPLLAEALAAAGNGLPLIQAIGWPDAADLLWRSTALPGATGASPGEAFPPTRLMVLADYGDGSANRFAAIFLQDSLAVAEAAAEALVTRWAEMPGARDGKTMEEATGAAATGGVIGAGPAAAYLTVDTAAGQKVPGGTVFSAVVQHFFRGDLGAFAL